MAGRYLCSDEEAIGRGFMGSDCARRRQVLRETIAAFNECDPPDRYHQLAVKNLLRWRALRDSPASVCHVEVVPGDWGEVTRILTRRYGVCFAVLNMANAYVPGGAYVEGGIAQEENMFRRTDCHFKISSDEFKGRPERYRREVTDLISAKSGAVYLDTQHPRVCIRGPEDQTRADLGYQWIEDEHVFPYFELRAAAKDLRDGSPFDPDDTRRRVAAQLDTMSYQRIRHVVLSAFGCGVFRNPADSVAKIYQEEIVSRTADFDVVAFAIFSAGYGPDNFTPFARELSGLQ